MDRKFIVVQLYLSGKGNKMFKSGDTVLESQLNAPADELIRRKAIKSADSKILDEKPEEASVGETEKGEPLFTFIRMPGEEEVKVYSKEDIKKKEVMQLLTEKEISFDRSKNEETLFNLLLENMK